MHHERTLILSHYHDDISNPIYNAYFKGINAQCQRTYFIDYFRLIGDIGTKDAEKEILTLADKEIISLIFIIFVSGDPILDPRFIQTLAENRFIVMVFWDMEQFFEQIDRYYAQLADLVLLTCNDEYRYKLQALNVNSLSCFSLFDGEKYKPISGMEQTIDVSFVGEVTKGKRQEYIHFLQENGIAIESFGKGTKNGKVSFEKVVEIFNRSKINLSFTGTYANDIYSYCSTINDRILQNKGKPIEIAMCGGFVLSEYVPSLKHVFPPDSIDTFKNKYELLEKIRYYLANDAVRKNMANCNYQYTIQHYDTKKAFETIFTHIETLAHKPHKHLILDTVFIKIHTTFHFFYAITFFLQGHYRLAKEEFAIVFSNRTIILKDVFAYIRYKFSQHLQVFRIKRKIKVILHSLKNRDVVFYGAGEHTLKLLDTIKPSQRFSIKAIADKNSDLWGTRICGIPIIPPQDIPLVSNHVVISSFAFEAQIYQQLLQEFGESVSLYKIYDGVLTQGLTQPINPYQDYRNMLKVR